MRAIVLLVIAIALSGCAALGGIGAGGSSPGAEEQARLAVDIVKAMQPGKGEPILVEDGPAAAPLAKKLREAGFAVAAALRRCESGAAAFDGANSARSWFFAHRQSR